MCGIAGIFNYKTNQPVDLTLLEKMRKSIVHRGPDEEGIYINHQEGIGFGHRRLSIIDLKTGKQPMSNGSKDIWIVYNGEVYNFPELKKELQGKGYHFRTTSDTEVIINFYKENGEKAFARLNGIFAFAIYDEKKKCVTLVRDHFGVKPLYYSMSNGKLLFGSEIKTILQDPSIEKELDFEAFNSFLTYRYNPSPQTLFKNIKKLHPGHYLKVTAGGNVELKAYWDYIPKTDNAISEREACEEYQRLLEKAVSRQMISDVPVGLLLSGGVDSAAIGYLMQKESAGKIKAFTIGFPGKGDYNELDDAHRTTELIGLEHYGLTISQNEYLDFFYDSFNHTEEPIAEPTIPALYYVSRLAAQHLKVVLAGQGADEPLAGYHRYLGAHYIGKFGSLLQMLPFKAIAEILPRNERLKRAAYTSQFSGELQRFIGVYTIFTPLQKEHLLRGDTKKLFHNADEALVERLYSQTSELQDSLSKMLFIDTRMNLSDNLLLFNDKITMANSLEMRVPYLDIELVQFLESLPSSFKIKRLNMKYLHKKAVKKWLPKEIIYRKKRGFATPMDEWLQTQLAQITKEYLNSKNSACRGYFNLDFINTMIDQHQKRKRNFQRHIFALLSFELWHRTFFENEKIEYSL
jgi:asparagine synthase (glutamine-hydrolysing)